MVLLGDQEMSSSNPDQGGNMFAFQILLLERTFKFLTTFKENVRITFLGSSCS